MNQDIIGMVSLKSPVHQRYLKHADDMRRGAPKPFPRLIAANLGNPQGYGQPPITFLRQLLALCFYPPLMEDPRIPADVKKRAALLLNDFPNRSVGSITNPEGLPVVRQHVALHLQDRDDGVPSNVNDIFLQDSGKLADMLFGLVADNDPVKPVGILTPVPCYPIYRALIHKHRMYQVVYYIDQDNNWEINLSHLKQVICDSRAHCRLKGIVIINPGNPTGHILTLTNIEDIIKVCYKEELFIFADEVYQNNILDNKVTFHSFKKVKHRMGEPYKNIELVSLNSISKGYLGESGLRGGYLELNGVLPVIKSQFQKAMSMHRCPNSSGQIAMDVLVKPPEEDEPSYELFQHEKRLVIDKMTQNAKMLENQLNKIEGIKVRPTEGGIFVYPQITNMPQHAVEKAECLEISPSLFWALELLDHTGVAVAPGTTFMEKPNTYHFRIPIILSTENIIAVATAVKAFHKIFTKIYQN